MIVAVKGDPKRDNGGFSSECKDVLLFLDHSVPGARSSGTSLTCHLIARSQRVTAVYVPQLG